MNTPSLVFDLCTDSHQLLGSQTIEDLPVEDFTVVLVNVFIFIILGDSRFVKAIIALLVQACQALFIK